MPYIRKEQRDRLDENLPLPLNAGQLTYVLSEICASYLRRGTTGGCGVDKHKYLFNTNVRYEDYAEVIGCLEATKLELYRRAVALYEDKKIEQNGDTVGYGGKE